MLNHRSQRLFIFLILICFNFTVEAKNHPEIQYLFPIPNTDHHPNETQLIIRFNTTTPQELDNLSSFIKINGEKSGEVNGKTTISSDKRTIIFKPLIPFVPGEEVQVHLFPRKTGMESAFIDMKYQFTISPMTEIPQILNNTKRSEEKIRKIDFPDTPETQSLYPIVQNGISFPTNFPWVNVVINDNPDTGNIFLCTYVSPYYSMIFDYTGNPIWYLKTSDRRRDFKVQKDGRLTMFVRTGYGGGSHIALDSTYAVVDTFFYPAGYDIDEHELQVLPNGHYFLLVYDSRYVDMSDSVEGGHSNARVVGNAVVEMDADDNCILFWRTWDHFNITDAIYQDLDSGYIESAHMNAIEIDHDGHILISSRSLSEVSKIHRQTGEFIWRLGGENNQFDWVNDEHQISAQHDIRVLSNGHYTVFDNGNHHVPYFSRALEIELDTLNMIATKVWEFIEDPPSYSRYLGNTQRLPNGNTLINWAVRDSPKLTEVRPDGSKAFEMDFVNSYDCYRTFRFPWKGKASVPYLVTESWNDRVTLLFNKFGDSEVAHYNVYGGLNPNPDQLITTIDEPLLHLRDLTNQATYYFRVTAVNSDGAVSGFSNEEKVYVNISEIGQNMVFNGDFSDGFIYWKWQVDTVEAVSQWEIDSTGTLHFQITNGGSDFTHVQVYYPNLQLIEGREYLFEFDAYAVEDRVIEADIKKLSIPYTNYSKIGYTLLNTSKSHFSQPFTMDDPTEFSAAIVFNAGNSEDDIYIDNVSLKELVTGINDKDETLPGAFALHENYPNPFNPSTTITYNIPEVSHVKITVYNLLGEKVEDLINLPHKSGIHQINFDSKNLSSGIYFYEMKASGVKNSSSYHDVKKMMLIK